MDAPTGPPKELPPVVTQYTATSAYQQAQELKSLIFTFLRQLKTLSPEIYQQTLNELRPEQQALTTDDKGKYPILMSSAGVGHDGGKSGGEDSTEGLIGDNGVADKSPVKSERAMADNPMKTRKRLRLTLEYEEKEKYVCMGCKEENKENRFDPRKHTHNEKFDIRWMCPLCDKPFAVTYRTQHLRNDHNKYIMGKAVPKGAQQALQPNMQQQPLSQPTLSSSLSSAYTKSWTSTAGYASASMTGAPGGTQMYPISPDLARSSMPGQLQQVPLNLPKCQTRIFASGSSSGGSSTSSSNGMPTLSQSGDSNISVLNQNNDPAMSGSFSLPLGTSSSELPLLFNSRDTPTQSDNTREQGADSIDSNNPSVFASSSRIPITPASL